MKNTLLILAGLQEKEAATGPETFGVCPLYAEGNCIYYGKRDEANCLRGRCNHETARAIDFIIGDEDAIEVKAA